jgi:predicted ABC-type ATPase
MWIIGGPNGSGKSTLITCLQCLHDFPSLYINADVLKIELDITDYEAMAKADELRNAALNQGISFAFETVMSHHSKIDLINSAKDLGYNIIFHFVITESPDINVSRVLHRHMTGGHDVPEDKIIARYYRSIKFLKIAFLLSDIAYVYNNSWNMPILIAEKTNLGKIIVHSMTTVKPDSFWNESNIKALLNIKSNN